MNLTIGAMDYRVDLVRGYPNWRGKDCYALSDHANRRVLVGDRLSFPMRLHALTYETMRAWRRYWPEADPAEQTVEELYAMVSARLMLRCVQEPQWLAPLRQAEGTVAADEIVLPEGNGSQGQESGKLPAVTYYPLPG